MAFTIDPVAELQRALSARVSATNVDKATRAEQAFRDYKPVSPNQAKKLAEFGDGWIKVNPLIEQSRTLLSVDLAPALTARTFIDTTGAAWCRYRRRSADQTNNYP